MRRRIILAVIVVAAVLVALRVAIVARDFDAIVTAEHFAALRDDHTGLRAFLTRMPKGGDLHVHLSGAIYAETYIRLAAKDGLCVQLANMFITAPPCSADAPAVADALRNQKLFDDMVDALSVRSFFPTPAVRSGHDQFFATFAKFGEASARHPAEMTVELFQHYSAQSVQYTELMVSFSSRSDRALLVDAIKDQTDFAAMLDTLNRNGLDGLVATARKQVADISAQVETLLACDPERTKPGCNVNYRLIIQISRAAPIKDVFVQTALAAAIIRAEPRVVALNFVQPEDNQVARADYSEQMRMIAFLAKDVPVALHAGELWLGLVPPPDLTFHIAEAVKVAGARRIGHGVSLAFEHEMRALLAEMRARPVAVEINLSSNDIILGVRGDDHPLPAYLAAGVPVVLSTDDPGVSRIDLSNEYFRATRDYRLTYPVLKAIARNALLYAFLGDADRKRELERFDASTAEFERTMAGQQPLPQKIRALAKAAAAAW